MYDPAPGSPYIEPTIFVEGNKSNVVHSFVYLGSTLSGGYIYTTPGKIIADLL